MPSPPFKMYFIAFAPLLAGAIASPFGDLDERDLKPSCSVHDSLVQSQCAKPTQTASNTKYCSACLNMGELRRTAACMLLMMIRLEFGRLGR